MRISANTLKGQGKHDLSFPMRSKGNVDLQNQRLVLRSLEVKVWSSPLHHFKSRGWTGYCPQHSTYRFGPLCALATKASASLPLSAFEGLKAPSWLFTSRIGLSSVIKTEGNFAVCNHMDGSEGHCAKGNKSDRERNTVWFQLYVESNIINFVTITTTTKEAEYEIQRAI